MKQWVTDAVSDYLQSKVDGVIIYDLMSIPDSQYNENSKL